MLAERRCGLKYYDLAVVQAGKPALIDSAFRILQVNYPSGFDWGRFAWAFANAIMELVANGKQIEQGYNLDDVFDASEMQVIADRAGLNISDYKPLWPRT